MNRAHVISFVARRKVEILALYMKRGRNVLLCNFILKYDGTIVEMFISWDQHAEVSQAGGDVEDIRGSRKVVTRRIAHSPRDTPANENYFSGVINVHRERIATTHRAYERTSIHISVKCRAGERCYIASFSSPRRGELMWRARTRFATGSYRGAREILRQADIATISRL